MRRAGRLNPFEDIRREDAEQVVNALDSLDPGSIILRNGPTSTAAASRRRARFRASIGARTRELPRWPLALASAALAARHGAARPAVGADPRHQRQARRPGAGRGHLSPDGARQPEGGAHLPKGHHMGSTPGMPEDEIRTTIVAWMKEKLVRVARASPTAARHDIFNECELPHTSVARDRHSLACGYADGAWRNPIVGFFK